MPTKPLRPCRHPGCRELVRCGYCDKHKPRDADRRSAESRQWHGWYSTKLWTDDLRPTQLLREPWCRECARHGIRTTATDVDHIEPHNGDWEKFTDRSNLQSLCHVCHSAKTMAESRAKSRGRSDRKG